MQRRHDAGDEKETKAADRALVDPNLVGCLWSQQHHGQREEKNRDRGEPTVAKTQREGEHRDTQQEHKS